MRASEKRQSSNRSNIENGPNQDPASPGRRRREGGEESRVYGNLRKRANKESASDYKALARRETKAVNVLRVLVLVVLFVTATLASVGVYIYLSNEETNNFEKGYQANAQRIIESFHDAVERRLGAVNSMASVITSHSLYTKQRFPFVTIPDFEIRGSDLRVQADTTGIAWMPLVTDETRDEWESYALKNHPQLDEALLKDAKLRAKQDDEFGLTNSSSTGTGIQQQSQQGTISDGIGYQPRIWSTGQVGPPGVEAEGRGPYLPLWQGR
jgi:hypothetical protein